MKNSRSVSRRLSCESLERRELMSASALANPAVHASPAIVAALSPSTSLKLLTHNASLYINTAHTRSAWFASGTWVTYRSDGSVVTGTLASNALLYVNAAHTQSVWFAAGGQTTFNADGSASAGTLLSNTHLYTDYDHVHSVWFAAGTAISFWSGNVNNNVIVQTGTLANKTLLNISYTQTAWFNAGTVVSFSGAVYQDIDPVLQTGPIA